MERRVVALNACAVAFISLAVNQLLGFVWPHPRPFMLGLGHTFIAHASDSSFPSDHATVFAAVGLTLVFANTRSVIGWVTLVLGACVAWARVFLGVHFPFDMAGAVAVVAVVWMAVYPLWRLVGEWVTSAICRLYLSVLARPIASGWIRP
jgi:undecaprenyl-diphosphatase